MGLNASIGVAVILVTGFLSIYALLRSPRSTANRLFSLLMLVTLIRALSSVGLFFGAADLALLYLSGAVFIHFSLEFPREKTRLRKELFPEKRWRLPEYLHNWDQHILGRPVTRIGFVYGPVLSIPVLAVLFPQWFGLELVQTEWGNLVFAFSNTAPAAPVHITVTAFYFIYTFGNFLRSYRLGGKTERAQIASIGLGLLLTAVLFEFGNLTGWSIPPSATGMPLFLACAYGVLRHRLFVIPTAETPSSTAPKFALEKGLCYLVREDRPALGYEVFVDAVTHGAQGLILTRMPLSRIRELYRLEKTPIVWVGEQPPSAEVPSASDPEELTYLCAKFLRESRDGIILLDSLEYLIQSAGFRKALHFVYHLKEIVTRHGVRFVLSVNPGSLGPRELALLEKEFEPFPPETQRQRR